MWEGANTSVWNFLVYHFLHPFHERSNMWLQVDTRGAMIGAWWLTQPVFLHIRLWYISSRMAAFMSAQLLLSILVGQGGPFSHDCCSGGHFSSYRGRSDKFGRGIGGGRETCHSSWTCSGPVNHRDWLNVATTVWSSLRLLLSLLSVRSREPLQQSPGRESLYTRWPILHERRWSSHFSTT